MQKGRSISTKVRVIKKTCADNEAMQLSRRVSRQATLSLSLSRMGRAIVSSNMTHPQTREALTRKRQNLQVSALTEKSRQRKRRRRKRESTKGRAEEEGKQTCRRAAKASPKLCRAALSTRVFTAFTPCLKRRANRQITSPRPVNKTDHGPDHGPVPNHGNDVLPA